MDNLILFPESYYYGIDKIEDSLEILEEINRSQAKLLSYCEGTNIKISDILYSCNRIKERLYELLTKLNKIRSIMIEMDPSIGVLYNKLDNKYKYIEDEKTNIDENLLDSIKGKNEETGANVVLNSDSILGELNNPNNVNKLLDLIKGNNEGTGSIKSLNVVSLRNGEVR